MKKIRFATGKEAYCIVGEPVRDDSEHNFREDAEIIFRMLIRDIPGGTYDALLCMIDTWKSHREDGF